MDTVQVQRDGGLWTVIINRPEARNAVDRHTAEALSRTFREFEADATASVAVLTGAGGHFCAGADLKAVADADVSSFALNEDMGDDGPMGPTRLRLTKPVIAAINGYAVAGGLELALWCDLRIADQTAKFGVFCRRWGVPLIDGGTVRLPRLIGESRAMDLILSGRVVDADEAHAIGLVNRKVRSGQALAAAQELGQQLAAFPQTCLRSDLASVRAQGGMPFEVAMASEFALGLATVRSGESREGAARFAAGAGRHGGKDTTRTD